MFDFNKTFNSKEVITRYLVQNMTNSIIIPLITRGEREGKNMHKSDYVVNVSAPFLIT